MIVNEDIDSFWEEGGHVVVFQMIYICLLFDGCSEAVCKQEQDRPDEEQRYDRRECFLMSNFHFRLIHRDLCGTPLLESCD